MNLSKCNITFSTSPPENDNLKVTWAHNRYVKTWPVTWKICHCLKKVTAVSSLPIVCLAAPLRFNFFLLVLAHDSHFMMVFECRVATSDILLHCRHRARMISFSLHHMLHLFRPYYLSSLNIFEYLWSSFRRYPQPHKRTVPNFWGRCSKVLPAHP